MAPPLLSASAGASACFLRKNAEPKLPPLATTPSSSGVASSTTASPSHLDSSQRSLSNPSSHIELEPLPSPGHQDAGLTQFDGSASSPSSVRKPDRKSAAAVLEDYKQFKRRCGLDENARLYVIRGNPHGAVLDDVRAAFELHGLIENVWEPESSYFDLQWGSRKKIDFSSLEPWQRVSNFERCGELTTKSGLADRLDDASFWNDRHSDTFCARTFSLNSTSIIDQWTTEFKASKALCILKTWLTHRDAQRLDGETFEQGVVRIALAVLKRSKSDIDALLDKDDNEAEQADFEVQADEWAVLNEADFDSPSKPSAALDALLSGRVERRRNRRRQQQGVEQTIMLLQEQAMRRQANEDKHLQERAHREEVRLKLQAKILKRGSSKNLAREDSSLVLGKLRTSLAYLSQPEEGASSPLRQPACSRSSSSPALRRQPVSLTVVRDAGATLSSNGRADLKRTQSLPLVSDPDEQELRDVDEGPSGSELVEAVRGALQDFKDDPQYDFYGRNIWIMKPSGKLRGQGIFLEDNLDTILKAANMMKGAGRMHAYICQKYIESPLLVGGTRKHDIRQWVAITSLNPLTIWFFSEAYVRLAANDYSLDDIHDQFAHLNNNAINCLHENYDPEDEYWRCQWGQAQYRKLLRDQYGSDVFMDKILPAMKRIVMDSIACVREPFGDGESSGSSFQLLGYDFLIDETLNTWLLEVNSDPLMHASCEVTERVVDPCFQDLVRIAMDGKSLGGPGPHWQLLYRGSTLPEIRPDAARQLPMLDCRPLVKPTGGFVEPTPDQLKAAQLRFQRQTSKELQELVHRRKQQQDKEVQKRERTRLLIERLRGRSLSKHRNRAAAADAAKPTIAELIENQTTVSDEAT